MNKSFLWVMSLAPVLLSACGGGGDAAQEASLGHIAFCDKRDLVIGQVGDVAGDLADDRCRQFIAPHPLAMQIQMRQRVHGERT